MTGIVDYGFYIPKNRIKVEEIANVWSKQGSAIEQSLNIDEKAVAGVDEDCLTMAFESSSMALNSFSADRKEIGAVFVGSESHPYAVNPSSTILAEFLGISGYYLASDTQFACKAATGAIISAFGLIKSGFTSYALVSGSDKAQALPHDALEYTASSGSVSLLLGKDNLLLKAVDYTSFSTDTPDFWRREGMRYPSHGGRFTGKPSYFLHIRESSLNLLKKTKLNPTDFAYAVFHMPNGKFPLQIGATLGFTKNQIEPSLVVRNVGNSYTASSLMGLVSVLDKAKSGDLIFFASFGSGAGSDAFVFQVTKMIDERRKNFNDFIREKEYINYATYLKYMEMI